VGRWAIAEKEEMNRPAKELGLEEKQIKSGRIGCKRVGSYISITMSFIIFLSRIWIGADNNQLQIQWDIAYTTDLNRKRDELGLVTRIIG
jgi:hypothetical protein